MRPLAWSLVATGVAAALLAASEGASNTGLRSLGAAGGAALAIAGAAFGVSRSRPPTTEDPADLHRTGSTRFFLERRRAPRHDVRIPVRFAVNGHTYPATLVSVGARGALLRLRSEPGEVLHAVVGQPVRIEDYPAGTLARIGTCGVYVDFAVRFEPAGHGVPVEAGFEPTSIGASRRA